MTGSSRFSGDNADALVSGKLEEAESRYSKPWRPMLIQLAGAALSVAARVASFVSQRVSEDVELDEERRGAQGENRSRTLVVRLCVSAFKSDLVSFWSSGPWDLMRVKVSSHHQLFLSTCCCVARTSF